MTKSMAIFLLKVGVREFPSVMVHHSRYEAQVMDSVILVILFLLCPKSKLNASKYN